MGLALDDQLQLTFKNTDGLFVRMRVQRERRALIHVDP
jgi:hypothetical protein